MLKALMRHLLRLHLRRPRAVLALLALLTGLACWGVLRVERRLDLLALLPREHPVIENSLKAGTGTEELLWLAAEGDASDLEARKRWLEGVAERLFTDAVPLNGLTAEGRLAPPVSVPGPKGAALWPPLLAAGALLTGDEAVLKSLGERSYALAPLALGRRLEPLLAPDRMQRALAESVADLKGLNPLRTRLAVLDPLRLQEGAPQLEGLRSSFPRQGLPFRLGTATLTGRDGRWVLLPVVLRFPTGEAKHTAAVVSWLARGAQGPLLEQASLAEMEAALAPNETRAFPLQVTGAHAIAAWESGHLGREAAWSLGLSFVLIGLVYFAGFRTLAGYGFVVAPLILGMFWVLGGLGLALGRLNLLVAVFGAILLGVGDDVGILLFSRYLEARRAGCGKALALKSTLTGTGPGILAGGLALAAAFLAFSLAPLPALRELGVTVGLGFLACLAASFLGLPALLLAFDREDGILARQARTPPTSSHSRRWKPWAVLAVGLLTIASLPRVRWQQDMRAFRRGQNPAMALQERLAKASGTGLQALALHLDLSDPLTLPRTWNLAAGLLRKEQVPMPDWQPLSPELVRTLSDPAWQADILDRARRLNLDEELVRTRLRALEQGAHDPIRALAALGSEGGSALQIPLRLPEEAQDRVQAGLAGSRAMLVGTRPMGQALKELAKEGLTRALAGALLAAALVVAWFGRSLRFALLAMVPLLASILGALGTLGLTGEPLGFLSLCALPIAMAVAMDLTMNLLHRARQDPGAPERMGRVNAVCAGTTLAGFGGLMFSGHAGLRGLGLAAFGGTALALLAVQWLLPALLARLPLHEASRRTFSSRKDDTIRPETSRRETEGLPDSL